MRWNGIESAVSALDRRALQSPPEPFAMGAGLTRTVLSLDQHQRAPMMKVSGVFVPAAIALDVSSDVAPLSLLRSALCGRLLSGGESSDRRHNSRV
ncbi:hypothetical protein AAFF_G00267000 [Aldrovandia affinis]|uniref:Uncharacterized protein n=1 Tax=Aldrovandia affinis TaxID=143900 RepID=A0AAD7RBF5_9TELE|nr:hypothetical protein AAFF_G00267000 [Aldrovandia affinis]